MCITRFLQQGGNGPSQQVVSAAKEKAAGNVAEATAESSVCAEPAAAAAAAGVAEAGTATLFVFVAAAAATEQNLDFTTA